MTPEQLKAAFDLACSRIDLNRADLYRAYQDGVNALHDVRAVLAYENIRDINIDGPRMQRCVAYWAGVIHRMLMATRGMEIGNA